MTDAPIEVLLVEDNPDDADVLKETLREHDPERLVRLHAVDRLADALQRLSQPGIDLVLLDLSLPDCHGLTTLSRTLAYAPNVPIVVLTGLDDASLGMEAVQSGAQDYLVKQYLDGRLLLRCMRYAIERHRLLREANLAASVWAGLALLGEAMMPAVGTNALLDRLIRLSTQLFEADFGHVWIWVPDKQVFRSSAANTPERWELIRSRTIKGADVVAIESDSPARTEAPRLRKSERPLAGESQGAQSVAYLVLHRNGEPMAILEWGRDAAHFVPSDRHERIATGLYHLASLGLETARLLEELEHSNTIKTYFAATMSHEIRNTLGVIRGVNDLVLTEVAEHISPQHQEALRLIRKRTDESLQIIDATLELTRSERRSNQGNLREVDIAALVADLAADMSIARPGSNVRLEWNVPASPPVFVSDPTQLKMVLKNLLGNALKFTREGYVRLTVVPEPEAIEFRVEDSGSGIPAEELPYVFEPFRQVIATKRLIGSAGLGLYIAHQLTGLLGGDVVIDSEVDRGTTVRVRFPLSPNGLGDD